MDITGCLQLYFSGNVNHFHILAFRGLQRLHDILGNGGKLEILGNLSKSIHHVKIPMVMNVIDIQSKLWLWLIKQLLYNVLVRFALSQKVGTPSTEKHPGFPCNQFGAQEPGTAEEVLFKNLPFSYLLLILFVQIGKRADCSPGVEWIWCRV